MSWPALADAALRASMTAFGRSVEYRAAGGERAENLRAVFDDAHVAVDPETGAEVHSTDPVLGVRLAALPDAIRARIEARTTDGDTVIVGAVRYRVAEVMPDGQGGATLTLKLCG